MLLSILLVLVVLLIIYLKYDNLNLKERCLAFVVLIIISSCAIDQIKNEQLTEKFENMQRELMDTEEFQDFNEYGEDMGGDNSKKFNDNVNNEFESVYNATNKMILEDNPPDNKDKDGEEQKSEPTNTDVGMNKDGDKFQNVDGSSIRSNIVNKATDMIDKAVDAAGSGSTVIKQQDGEGVSSIFSPQIIIRDSDYGNQEVALRANNNSREIPIANRRRPRRMSWNEPTHDLWSDEHSYYDNVDSSKDPWNSAVNNWNVSMKVHGGKRCRDDDPSKPDQSRGESTNYQNSAKKFYPGYAYQPPSNWDVPQKRAPVCVNSDPDTTKLPIGIADHGTPIFALEVDPIGRILATEEKVQYTNVGSILPKFNYTEIP